MRKGRERSGKVRKGWERSGKIGTGRERLRKSERGQESLERVGNTGKIRKVRNGQERSKMYFPNILLATVSNQ